MQRSGKLTAVSYLKLFVLNSKNALEESLSYQASMLKSLFDISITKQALDQRINTYSNLFLKSIIEDLLKEKLQIDTCFEKNLFKNIRIKDSTQFKLPDHMENIFPGYGGSSKSVAKIQFEYSFTSGRLYELSFTHARENDMKNANQTIDNIEEGDLIVRDLGYVSTEVCKKINQKKAYFINRLKGGTNIYDLNGKILNIKSLKSSLKKSATPYIEKNVLIGSKYKFPVRLIISGIDDQERKRREYKQIKKSKDRKRGKVNQEVLSSKSLNLFITNISEEDVSADKVYKYYKLRWQIELIFKAWKSIYKINQVKPVKVERFQNYLYSTFIWILINWQAIMGTLIRQIEKGSTLISLQKIFKMINSIRTCITYIFKDKDLLALFYVRTMESWIKHNLLEKRKNRLSLNEIIAEIRL